MRVDRKYGSYSLDGYSLVMNQEASRGPAKPASAASRGTGRPPRRQPARPSLGGGTPAQDRELRAQGRETVRKLLEAGIVEFEERGFQGVRVDDVVSRAGISHGTFYMYFSNKEDLFKALMRDALHDMEIVAGDFPVVTSDETGLKVLRRWVHKFFKAYAAHAAGKQQDRAELTAVACLMMLERVNYLISTEIRLPEEEMADRIADIMFAAFGLTVG